MNVRNISLWSVGAWLGLLLQTQGAFAQTPPVVNIGNTAAGVVIDAEGTLRMQAQNDPSGNLTRKRLAEAKAALAPNLAKASGLRKISLNRLEAALAAGKVTDDMANLAGLTKIQYVFYYPETRDIVIAGPAEPFGSDLSGRMIGMETGRAVLQLADLVVALRAFAPGGRGTQIIGCSIDPTKEGLASMQAFLARVGRTNPGPVGQLVKGLKDSLGDHVVTVNGISPKTHFAQVLVEADYRMKLIGIGLEKPGAKITAYVTAASPTEVSRNAMQRWYFVPNYECVRVSDDRLAAELVGDGVKLIGESELVAGSGQRTGTGKMERASEVFTTSFTKQYSELSRRVPVYAQLRNLIDMSVAAAFIQQQDWYSQAGWKMEVLGNEQSFPVETLAAPAKVETAINALWKDNRLMTPIGGGVKIEANAALAESALLKDDSGLVKQAREKIDLSKLPAKAWWWD